MSDEGVKETVSFHYLKSKDFRTIYVEGVIGSVTPADRVVCVFYNERAAIPNSQTFSMNEDGSLGSFISAEGKSGFVRELEIALSLDRDSTEALIAFLSNRLKELDSEEEGDDKDV